MKRNKWISYDSLPLKSVEENIINTIKIKYMLTKIFAKSLFIRELLKMQSITKTYTVFSGQKVKLHIIWK